jgi:hypothetical protein
MNFSVFIRQPILRHLPRDFSRNMAADDIERIRKFLAELKDENINFRQHFYGRAIERPISEALVREYLKRTDRLVNIEEQTAKKEGDEKYKLWFRLSNKYSLVLVAVVSEKDLNVRVFYSSYMTVEILFVQDENSDHDQEPLQVVLDIL